MHMPLRKPFAANFTCIVHGVRTRNWTTNCNTFAILPAKASIEICRKKRHMKIFLFLKKKAALGSETTTALERKSNRFSCERFQNSENRQQQQNYVR